MHIAGNNGYRNRMTKAMNIAVIITGFILIAWVVCYAVLETIRLISQAK